MARADAMGCRALPPLLLLLAMAAAATGQSTDGFVSIDCGLEADSSYADAVSGMIFSPDAGYCDRGVNVVVPQTPEFSFLAKRYFTLRSFPNGTRNCYTISQLVKGGKYLVIARFFYGNYDGKNKPPKFDIYLGGNFWKTVNTESDDTVHADIIAISPGSKIQICLVNTGNGTPFISVLEVRRLPDSMYTPVNASQSLVLNDKRMDYAGAESSAYPGDPYDRLWFGTYNRTGWKVVRTDREIKRRDGDPPSGIMQTAIVSDNLLVNFSALPGDKLWLFLYFAELELLEPNQTREFNMLLNGKLLYGPYRPSYLQADSVISLVPGGVPEFLFTLEATANSSLPPMINAREIYILRQLAESPTNESDADSISNVRDFYKVTRNWQGDPCVPQNLSWEGVSCLYNASQNHQIVSLNLSYSGLQGEISPFIGDLLALTSLDMSHNNLTGEIPSFVASLPNLRVLKLESNQLIGLVPPVLLRRSQDGSLSLSIEENSQLCIKAESCKKTDRGKMTIVLIIVGVTVSAILFGMVILAWRIKERKRHAKSWASQETCQEDFGVNLVSNVATKNQDWALSNYRFSYPDIVNITKNFEYTIGKGGFGTVCHGYLRDGTEVAVKMISQSSSQGAKEFLAEAQILTTVHHKNLLSLLGYCDDKTNLALVYEYMHRGTLADLLSHNSDRNGNVELNWDLRIKIALDVAEGLHYLHSFCKPAIVHRDVKTRNILLNKNFEAKIGDFGLSRPFPHEDATHISTMVAGTPGYLDPEYHQTFRLTEKSDVYSFGIVLLEIITGRHPIRNDPQDGPLLEWVQSKLATGDISDLVDDRLHGKFSINSIWKAAEVAIWCASPKGASRPKMSEVVMQLKKCVVFVAQNDTSTE